MQPRFQTKAQFAAESIREAIRDGSLGPGERIEIESLAAPLGMSPTPVREALRLLEAEGLVVNEPHRGPRVKDFATDDAAELYRLRAVLETFATRLSVPRFSPTDIDELQRLEESRRAALDAGRIPESSELNRNWHMSLYAPAMVTPYLNEFIGRLWNAFPWSTAWRVPGRATHSIADHAAIMEAVIARDPDRAAALLEQHITRSQEAVVELLRSASR
jgi:DNA-binding GntR family transcriptional regulator